VQIRKTLAMMSALIAEVLCTIVGIAFWMKALSTLYRTQASALGRLDSVAMARKSGGLCERQRLTRRTASAF
jgi:hypothetical protein